jgi:hypothetical protein
MKYKPVDVTLARETFTYEPDTGLLRRKKSGKPAGTLFNTGHLQVHFNKRMVGVHRIIWAVHYGEDPELQIDHINGDGADNRLCNLRLATNAQNCMNARIDRRNKVGVKNVFRVKWSNRVTKTFKWRVAVGLDRSYAITHFDCLGRAIAHAKQARAERHGEFANNGHMPVGVA